MNEDRPNDGGLESPGNSYFRTGSREDELPGSGRKSLGCVLLVLGLVGLGLLLFLDVSESRTLRRDPRTWLELLLTAIIVGTVLMCSGRRR